MSYSFTISYVISYGISIVCTGFWSMERRAFMSDLALIESSSTCSSFGWPGGKGNGALSIFKLYFVEISSIRLRAFLFMIVPGGGSSNSGCRLATCCRIAWLTKKRCWHTGHSYFRSSCTLWCTFKAFLVLKADPQTWHLCGRTSVCVAMCRSSTVRERTYFF